MEKYNNGQQCQQSKIDKMFYLVKDKENKINVCVGGYAVSDKKFDTFKQADEFISTKPWQLIVNICSVLIKINKENENNKENKQDK